MLYTPRAHVCEANGVTFAHRLGLRNVLTRLNKHLAMARETASRTSVSVTSASTSSVVCRCYDRALLATGVREARSL